MKRRKLKRFVLPTLYLIITISTFIGIIILETNFNLMEDDYDYGTGVLKEDVRPVVKEEEQDYTIDSPVDTESTSIEVHYYSKDDDEEKQQNSLIYFDNTYLPNTGILYTDNEEFYVQTIYSGKVVDITKNDFFENCVIVEHSNNFKSYYYGLEDLEVAVGDDITKGTIIGTSKNNPIKNSKKSFLLEVYYNNKLTNPESIIGTRINEYN